MRGLLISLFTTIIAISISLVSNAELNKNRSVRTYYQITNGLYVTGIPVGTCSQLSLNPCSITYLIDPGVVTFSIYNPPQGFHINSLGIGIMEF